MKAKIWYTKYIKHLKGHICLELGQRHLRSEPRPIKGASTKGITALPREGMPIGHGEAQMLFEAFAHDHFIGVVMAKGKLIVRLQAFILNLRNALEEISHRTPF